MQALLIPQSPGGSNATLPCLNIGRKSLAVSNLKVDYVPWVGIESKVARQPVDV